MPRKEDLKNWKIKECFISDRDGWCNHCKTRTWKKGHKIYWMEKPNHAGWAACTDKKCYLEQGGKITQVEGGTTTTSGTIPHSLNDYLIERLETIIKQNELVIDYLTCDNWNPVKAYLCAEVLIVKVGDLLEKVKGDPD